MSETTVLPSNAVATADPVIAPESPYDPGNAPKSPFDWRNIVDSTEGRLSLLVLAALCFAFVGFWKKLSGIWFEPDSLYSHGPLIPLMGAYIVHERWPKLRTIPIKGATWAIVPILLVMYVTWVASRTVMTTTLAALFMASLSLSVLFIGGWKWFVATLGPVLYLVFAFPFWTGLVDKMTQPLQALSTEMAMRILEICGLHPYRVETTTVMLDNFQFNVAAACSGAKTTLALLAFSVFFIMLNRGRWYSSLGLLLLLLPFSLAINGLRIALVGIIGNAFGSEAGMAFHDYGAYVVLIGCFLLLAQIAKLLGFKQ